MSQPLAVDFSGAVTDGFRTVATFVPKLVGALLILLVGYFIAKIVAKLVDKALERVGFDRAVERGGLKKVLEKSQYDASDIVSKLVFFAIFIPFLAAAVGTLGIAALTGPMQAFIALIPKIIVAIVLVVIGAALATAAKKFIEGTLGGLSYGKALGIGAAVLIMLGFLKAALDQVGIATTVTGPLLYAILGTIAGIAIVGVGGGLIKPMQSRWENALNKASDEASNMKQQAQQSQSQSSGQDQQQQYSQPVSGYPSTGAAAYPTEPAYGTQPQPTYAPTETPTQTYGTQPGYGQQ